MPKLDITRLLSHYPIISDQVSKSELQIILQTLQTVLDTQIAGDVCEFGCYIGTTSLFLQRLLERTNKTLHVYDSFAGLPEKSHQDQSAVGEQFKPGELSSSKATFIQNFRHAGVQLPMIHKAWFKDLTSTAIPNLIAFAFLDGDYYQSIKDSLRLIEEHLSAGSVIIIDDYMNEALPGASQAVDEWLMTHPGRLHIEASLAIIKPTI